MIRFLLLHDHELSVHFISGIPSFVQKMDEVVGKCSAAFHDGDPAYYWNVYGEIAKLNEKNEVPTIFICPELLYKHNKIKVHVIMNQAEAEKELVRLLGS